MRRPDPALVRSEDVVGHGQYPQTDELGQQPHFWLVRPLPRVDLHGTDGHGSGFDRLDGAKKPGIAPEEAHGLGGGLCLGDRLPVFSNICGRAAPHVQEPARHCVARSGQGLAHLGQDEDEVRWCPNRDHHGLTQIVQMLALQVVEDFCQLQRQNLAYEGASIRCLRRGTTRQDNVYMPEPGLQGTSHCLCVVCSDFQPEDGHHSQRAACCCEVRSLKHSGKVVEEHRK
mmetsp:Transcript_65224/g.152653  ORF Transcript_65224/g.152653 Transcript_65224/m.152653 type:complete len:229 (+) Transcript_65224:87-773(+)